MTVPTFKGLRGNMEFWIVLSLIFFGVLGWVGHEFSSEYDAQRCVAGENLLGFKLPGYKYDEDGTCWSCCGTTRAMSDSALMVCDRKRQEAFDPEWYEMERECRGGK